MNLPSIVAQRFLIACLLGCALGIYYEFLRPLRKKWTNLSDIAFVVGAFWVWLYLGFGVCEGDLRFGFSVALLGSSILFVVTIGSWLKPLFSIFWRVIGHILGVFAYPIKQFYKNIRFFSKFLFARVKKWGTMKKDEKKEVSDLTKKKRKFAVRFQRSSPLLKCALLATIVLSLVTILLLQGAISGKKDEYDQNRANAAELEQENQELKKSIAELGTVQSIKHIASKYLDLVDPDTIFFEPVK